MEFGAVSAKQPPAFYPSSSASAPDGVRQPASAQLLNLQVLLKNSDALRVEESRSEVSHITKRDYPALVELRLAGRSDREIARRFDSPLRMIRGHVAQAMAMYRRGEIIVRSGETVMEARAAGEEKAAKTTAALSSQPSSETPPAQFEPISEVA